MESQNNSFRLLSWVISAIFLGGLVVAFWASIVGNTRLYNVLWPVLLISAGVLYAVGALFIDSPFARALLGPTTVLGNSGVRSRHPWFLVAGAVLIVSGVLYLLHVL